ncbi:MAG TPA: ATP-binding protein [Methylophilaceae bacterium]|jgi:two-component system sensor histidine kinase RpfC
MKEQLRFFMQQVRARDGEHEQSLIRVFLAFLIFGFLFIEYELVKSTYVTKALFVFSGVWFACAVLLILVILVGRVSSRKRQWLMMFADISAVTYGMLITQETGTLYWGIYLWVIVGNGLRYGTKPLIIAYVYSLIGFAGVILLNPYWPAHPRLAVGMLLTLLLIPLYILKLRNQLNTAIESATEANKAKSQFLANMSHEMRTPLNGVVGAGDLLMATQLNEEQVDLTNTMQHSAQILLKLIDNVLDLSKIESGKISTETADFDLHRLVHSTIDMFASQASKKGLRLNVRFTPETAFSLRGDSLHLKQVLINLIGNAIKFTDTGMVDLRISTLTQERTKTSIRFEVIDTGIGIAADAQKAIFESFTQADSTIASTYGGTGLGTTIANQLVHLMGGQMGLSSELGIGSMFWFELPFEKQPENVTDIGLQSLNQLQVISVGITVNERETIGGYFTGWDIKFEHETYLPPFFSRLQKNLKEQPEGLIILCELQNLGVNAKDFATRVFEICPGKTVTMMMVNPDFRSNTEQEFLEMGYACLLKSPIYKTILFNALHGVMAPRHIPGTISLREYRKRKSLEQHTIKILVAEDNGTNRKIISKMLEHGGYHAEMAEDGEQALDMLESKHYDMMILDLNMPVHGGLEVMKIYRASNMHSPRIPVAILTANATVEAIKECEDAGVDAYLSKPVDAVTLLETVAKLTALPQTGEPNVFDAESDDTMEEASLLLDLEVLRKLAQLGEGDENFLQTVVHGFISETEKLLMNLQSALTKGECKTFKELAHVMKGSSGNVGAKSLNQICREMMQLDPAAFEEPAGELLIRAQSNFKSTKLMLFQYLNDSKRISL